MTEQEHGSEVPATGLVDDGRDAAWEIAELAPVVILVSFALLIVGGLLDGWLTTLHQASIPDIDWVGVQYATRWAGLVTTALLLGALAVCWWQYGQWFGPRHNRPRAIAAIHVRRIRGIVRWLLASFILSILAVLVLDVASIVLNGTAGGDAAFRWGQDLEAVFSSLSVIVIAGLGVVAALRVTTAASNHLGADEDSDG